METKRSQTYFLNLHTSISPYLGQLKLKNGKVLIVGMGGLGCPVAMYLAAGGVGLYSIIKNVLNNQLNYIIQKCISVS